MVQGYGSGLILHIPINNSNSDKVYLKALQY